jgi:citrate lyase subunit beta-like protein
MDSLRAECLQGASFGFTGKQAIHPAQIPTIHEAFSPSKESVEHAERLLQQYLKEDAASRRGAWEFEGKMIDKPVITLALRTLRLAVNLKVASPEASETLEKASQMRREADNAM